MGECGEKRQLYKDETEDIRNGTYIAPLRKAWTLDLGSEEGQNICMELQVQGS